MLSKLSLKTKILSICLGLASTLLISGLIGMMSLSTVAAKYNHVAHNNMSNAAALSDMRSFAAECRRYSILMSDMQIALADVAKYDTKLHEAIALYAKADKAYLDIPFAEGEESIYQASNQVYKEFLKTIEEIAVLRKEKDPKKFDRFTELTKLRVEFSDAHLGKLAALIEFQEGEARKWVTSAEQSASLANTLAVVVTLVGFLLCALTGWLFSRSLSGALASVTERLSSSGTEVSSASEQLAASSEQLSSGATEAASSLEETVASVEELSSMVKLNADNAKEAATLSLTSRESAELGESEMRKLNTAMTDIAQSSKKIEEIINVIDDIAFQTNLLALNAAVEAARAGDQGKGFAVVAEAVRALAQRSASAAKEITTLIKDSVSKIDRGSKIADDSSAALKSIVTSVKKVADLNNEIAAASGEQASGLAQISQAMNELDQATQRNASAAQECSASSTEMSSQAVSLQTMVGELLSLVHGGNADSEHGDMQRPAHAPRRQQPRPLAAAAKRRPTPKVVPINSRVRHASDAEQRLPLDGPDTFGKVGNTNGF